MNDADFKKISQIIDEKLGATEKRLETSLNERLEATFDEKLAGSEKRLREEISGSEKRVIKGFVDFVSDQLMPVIDEKADKTDIDRIERKLDYYNARTMENTHRLDVVESLPTVAHELKFKRKTKS